jgi:hypothetical protein
MKRLWVLLCALLCCGGCLTEADKAQWREAWKDARGDNQNMRSDFGGGSSSDDSLRNGH